MDTKYCDECDKSVSRKNWARHMSLKHSNKSDDSDIESSDDSASDYSTDDNESLSGKSLVKKLEQKLRMAKRARYIFKEENDGEPDEKIGKLYLHHSKAGWYVADSIRHYNEWARPNLTEALEELDKIKQFLASKFDDFEEHMEEETEEDEEEEEEDDEDDY